MPDRSVSGRIRLYRLFWPLVALLAIGFVGCAGSPGPTGPQWPSTEVTPEQPPEALEEEADSTVLRRGHDGFLYAVGGVPGDIETGTPFFARYSGDWPLQDSPRPPQAAGRVIQRLDDQTALVHVSYRLPEAELEDLEVTWEDRITDERVGKGLGRVASVDDDSRSAELSIGRDPGVQTGDAYGILTGPSQIDSPLDAQLSRRLKSICVVESVSDQSATCQLRSSWRNKQVSVQKGDNALFLEHTLEKPPRQAVVRIGAVAGNDDSGEAREAVTKAFQSMTDAQPNANIETEKADYRAEATRKAFHRVESELEYDGRSQMFVGLEVVGRDGTDHLVVNYTGVGPVTGAGMVAAPPTGGVDLGPVDDLESEDLRPFAHVVWSAMLVYRGETAYALDYLHGLLSMPELEGPLRWHTRDQYAMRWGALDNYEEALWLVHQDRAVARGDDNRKARLNAFGTLVRLYDFVGLTDRAIEAAEEYLGAYEQAKPDTEWLSAVGMLAELQVAAGRIEKAQSNLDALREACPDGCGGDLFSYLTNSWWSIPNDAGDELAGQLLDELTELAEGDERHLAAVRLYQGIDALRGESYEQALIGFMESARLYKKLDLKPGLARAKYFEMVAHMQRDGKNQNAYEAGQRSLELRRGLHDFDGIARVYSRMAGLFTNVDFKQRPGPYLRSARSTLTKAYETQRAAGAYGKAGQALYTLGSFLFKFGQHESAVSLFRRAIGYSISATQFDVAAMSHLHLAMIARRQKDQQTFQSEIDRARTMAKLADSPQIEQAIERALNPDKQNKKGQDPTQML